jgi:hypothetical protein
MKTQNDFKIPSVFDYITGMGMSPVRRKGNWLIYKSPFRKEDKASFYLNIENDFWKDFGLSGDNTSGGLVSLIALLECISKKDAFKKAIICEPKKNDLYLMSSDETKFDFELIFSDNKFPNRYIEFIMKRGIDVNICSKFLKFARYSLKFKSGSEQFYEGLMYRNVIEGYEIITVDKKKFCYNGKSYTFFNKNSKRNVIFEGIFDYIAWIQTNMFESEKYNAYILNGVVMDGRLITDVYNYNRQKELYLLFLDNDKAGDRCTRFIGSRLVNSLDQRDQYKLYSDYNDYIIGKKIKKGGNDGNSDI